MAGQRQSKSGGARKHGRNKDKCKRYRSRNMRFKNKLARILKSNGESAANIYRLAHLKGERAAI